MTTQESAQVPPPRRRCWLWWLLAALAALAVLWALVGDLAICAVAGRWLPLHLVDGSGDGVEIERAFHGGGHGPVAVTVAVSPERLRRLAAGFGRSVPPGLLFQGLGVAGGFHHQELAELGVQPFAALIDRGAVEGPLITVKASARQLNALMERITDWTLSIVHEDDVRCVPVFAAGSLAEDRARDNPPGASRHRVFHAQLWGKLRLEWSSGSYTVTVNRLVGRFIVDFAPVAGGLHPLFHVEIDEAAADLPLPLPLAWGGSQALGQVLEDAINRSFLRSRSLRSLVLPEWVPTDFHLAAAVVE